MKIKIFLFLCFYLNGMFVMFQSVSAWTETNIQSIAYDAKKLMPANLQWMMEKYSYEFMRGIQTRSEKQLYDEEAIGQILDASDRCIHQIRKQKSYKHAVYIMGRIARLSAQFNDILSKGELLAYPSWRTDYDIYLEKNRHFFRIRWLGIENRPRTKTQLKDMLKTCQNKIKKLKKFLLKTLKNENKPIATYDHRSIPFGTGSISYSNAVSTAAMVWLYIWHEVGGISSHTEQANTFGNNRILKSDKKEKNLFKNDIGSVAAIKLDDSA